VQTGNPNQMKQHNVKILKLRRHALPAIGALFAIITGSVQAQDTHGAPCLTSVVLKNCPDRQPTPFQTDAERSDSAQRQQMQDQFASTEEQHRRRVAQAEQDLDGVTIYGHREAPVKPALTEFGKTVANSGPKDCRSAYTMSGPGGRFGVYDLLHDTLTGKPCSWK
jgi:hypothetical protein